MKAIAYASTINPITGRDSPLTHIVVDAETVDALHDAAYNKLTDMGLIDEETSVSIKLEFIGVVGGNQSGKV